MQAALLGGEEEEGNHKHTFLFFTSLHFLRLRAILFPAGAPTLLGGEPALPDQGLQPGRAGQAAQEEAGVLQPGPDGPHGQGHVQERHEPFREKPPGQNGGPGRPMMMIINGQERKAQPNLLICSNYICQLRIQIFTLQLYRWLYPLK